MHPTLVRLGPWEPIHLPLIFAFFAVLVGIWTWLERRGSEQGLQWSWRLVVEVVVQAAIPTVIIYLLVNRIGPLLVRSYGVMMLGAFVAALLWMYYDRERYGFTRSQVLQVALLGFAGGIVGGRIGYVLLGWEQYAGQMPSIMDLWRGGLSWHGGLAGALITLGIATPLIGVSFARSFDLSAPGLAVGYAVARVGCFLNACCYGHECSLPWAVTFPQIAGRSIPEVAVHPTQLYAAIGSLIFVLPLILLLTPYLRRPFSRFFGFVVLYSILRFVVEIFRRDATGEVWQVLPVFTIAQAASIALIIIFTAVVLVREWPLRRAGAGEQ